MKQNKIKKELIAFNKATEIAIENDSDFKKRHSKSRDATLTAYKSQMMERYLDNQINLKVFAGIVHENGIAININERKLILSDKDNKVTHTIVLRDDLLRAVVGEDKYYLYKDDLGKIGFMKARSIGEVCIKLKKESHQITSLGWVALDELKTIANTINKELSYE